MPYASKAQARKFHSDPALQKYTAEFDSASRGKDLPERKHPKPTLHQRVKKGLSKAFPK